MTRSLHNVPHFIYLLVRNLLGARLAVPARQFAPATVSL
jgi:hypothetical protein